MTRSGISDLAVVELDRCEGGIQFLDCGICPEEPAWWRLNHALGLHGLPQSYPRSKQVFEDGCQIRYNLQPFGSSTAPPVLVTMNAYPTCPAILMERLKMNRCVDFLRCLSGRTIVFSGKRLYYQTSIAVYGFFDNIIACGWRCFVERFNKRRIRISLHD